MFITFVLILFKTNISFNLMFVREFIRLIFRNDLTDFKTHYFYCSSECYSIDKINL